MAFGSFARGSGGPQALYPFLGKPQTRYPTSPCLAHRTWKDALKVRMCLFWHVTWSLSSSICPVKTMSLLKPPHSHKLHPFMTSLQVKIAKFTLIGSKFFFHPRPYPMASPTGCKETKHIPVYLNGTLSKALPSSDPPPSPPWEASRPSSPAYSP